MTIFLVNALAVSDAADVSFNGPVPRPAHDVRAASDPDARVNVLDDALRKCIEETLGKSGGEPITRREMAVVEQLDCTRSGVAHLSGIEYAENLRFLYLYRNQISDLAPLAHLPLVSLEVTDNQVSDLTPLSHLTSLRHVYLSVNRIVDLSPLAGLTKLEILGIYRNSISDLSPLATLSSLSNLSAAGNQISDLRPLEGLVALKRLALERNRILDLTPLEGLTVLQEVRLDDNEVSDLAALATNDGIGEGDTLYIRRNLLSCKSVDVDIPELVERGVEVFHDPPETNPIPDDATIVEFADEALERVIRRRMGRGEGCPIAASEIENFFSSGSFFPGLALADLGIESLSGLEFATGLEWLDLSNNRVTDLASLAGLTSLVALWLSGNPISDLSPIAGLSSIQSLTLDNTGIDNLAPLAGRPNLFSLALDGNSLEDVSALEGNFNLNRLSLGDNRVSDIDALANMEHLQWLSLDGNEIASLEPLAGLPALRHLNVNDNEVRDLNPLEDHPSLEELLARNNRVDDLSPLRGRKLALVGLQGNPLDDSAISQANALRDSGATVLLGHVVPYFPAAGEGREGFVRIINRGIDGGDVFIEALDDQGMRFGPVSLPMGPKMAVHINSDDLERGDRGKGLSVGIGPPSGGDWRLELISPLDIEVLSYVRTEDGLVTAMHDVAADSVLPFFNPGANNRQRSILRVVNTEAGPAKWLTGGHDDNGVWWAMPNAVLVPPGHGLTATVQALEEEHGLGDGAGKWRLRVPRWPWLAMSLLESPTGHLTNLSTAPANVERLANGMARHRLPLFLAAGGSRESFARVVNRSPQAGEIEIEAIDDAGNVLGPVRLNVPGRKTVHFNSRDLQNGNAAKGLSGGLGAGDGDWRLAFTTALDLQVLSYVRTADGFLTAMHDLAPVAEDGGHRVVFFNPGSNTAQLSRLRLMNNGDEAAQVTITGIDDEGMPSGTVALTLAGRRTLTLTAAQLETGGDGRSGRLGDGTGKWRLRVHSDSPLMVMSLLENPTGHLTNLSTATAKVERNPWPVSADPQARPLAREGSGANSAVDFGKGGD